MFENEPPEITAAHNAWKAALEDNILHNRKKSFRKPRVKDVHAWEKEIDKVASLGDDPSFIPDYVLTEDFLLTERLSLTDPLTGLSNERYFHRELAKFQQEVISGEATGAVLLLDLNNLKEINDDMGGHDVGDAVLQYIAFLLKQNTKKERDICSRLHGDEYALILRGITKEELLEICQRLELVFMGGRDNGGHIVPTIAIGAVHASDIRPRELKHITECADFMLYGAKDQAEKLPKIADVDRNGRALSVRKQTQWKIYDRKNHGTPKTILKNIRAI